jgi:type IV secretion system protein VirB10
LVLGLAAPVQARQSDPVSSAPASPGATQQAPAQGSPDQSSGAAPAAPSAPAKATPGPSNTAPSKSGRIEVPTGTHIPLVLHNAISTRSARPGDPVYFETLFPVMVGGRVVIPAGSYVSGEITEAKRAGRVKGRAELMVKLTTMILPNAYTVNLNAASSGAGTGGGESVNREGQVIGDTDKASDVGTVAKTTTAGAGIGAIAARSGKGAGIGAGVGAAAGLAAVLLSRGPEAEMPRGSTLEAVLDRPIFLDADKVQFTSPGQASTLPGPPNREPQRNKIPF